MLVLSRKLNQEIVFPTIGIRIEVARIRGATVCLGIDAPKELPILRGELRSPESALESPDYVAEPMSVGHELRNRLNAMSLCLHIMLECQDSGLPIKPQVLARAIQEMHLIEEVLACTASPNPFANQISEKVVAPFVMLIDDAVNETELMASYLRHVGIQVAVSSDGNAALQLLECIDRKPDLILLDMVMPGRDGPSTLQELRSNPNYAGIKVFAVTGLASDSVTDKAAPTADRWFQKPVHFKQLVHQIRSDLAVPA